jgi:hypothetical protein
MTASSSGRKYNNRYTDASRADDHQPFDWSPILFVMIIIIVVVIVVAR